MELKSEGAKSGHLPSDDPLGDLMDAAENANFQGVAEGINLFSYLNPLYYLPIYFTTSISFYYLPIVFTT